MRQIIGKAEEIRKNYGLDDLHFAALELGANVVEVPFPSDTIIREIYLKDSGTIVIDSNLQFYKKRHLIAHAIAHHLFHRKTRINYFEEQIDFLKDLKLRKQEREAEVFAAYFLIPEEELNAVLKEEWVKESTDPIPELAEEFQVSENFMKKRLKFEDIFKRGLNQFK